MNKMKKTGLISLAVAVLVANGGAAIASVSDGDLTASTSVGGGVNISADRVRVDENKIHAKFDFTTGGLVAVSGDSAKIPLPQHVTTLRVQKGLESKTLKMTQTNDPAMSLGSVTERFIGVAPFYLEENDIMNKLGFSKAPDEFLEAFEGINVPLDNPEGITLIKLVNDGSLLSLDGDIDRLKVDEHFTITPLGAEGVIGVLEKDGAPFQVTDNSTLVATGAHVDEESGDAVIVANEFFGTKDDLLKFGMEGFNTTNVGNQYIIRTYASGGQKVIPVQPVTRDVGPEQIGWLSGQDSNKVFQTENYVSKTGKISLYQDVFRAYSDVPEELAYGEQVDSVVDYLKENVSRIDKPGAPLFVYELHEGDTYDTYKILLLNKNNRRATEMGNAKFELTGVLDGKPGKNEVLAQTFLSGLFYEDFEGQIHYVEGDSETPRDVQMTTDGKRDYIDQFRSFPGSYEEAIEGNDTCLLTFGEPSLLTTDYDNYMLGIADGYPTRIENNWVTEGAGLTLHNVLEDGCDMSGFRVDLSDAEEPTDDPSTPVEEPTDDPSAPVDDSTEQPTDEPSDSPSDNTTDDQKDNNNTPDNSDSKTDKKDSGDKKNSGEKQESLAKTGVDAGTTGIVATILASLGAGAFAIRRRVFGA